MHINPIISMLVILVKFLEIEITLEQQACWICKSSILLCLHWTEYTVTILQLSLFLYKKIYGSMLSNLTSHCARSSLGCFVTCLWNLVVLRQSLISMSFQFRRAFLFPSASIFQFFLIMNIFTFLNNFCLTSQGLCYYLWIKRGFYEK